MENLAHGLLREMTEAFRALGSPMALYEFVLEHGEGFEGAEHAEEKGAIKECFANAAREVMHGDTNLTYTEGYVVSKDLGIPILHAWLVDEDDNVIETTLRGVNGGDLTGYHYFGVRYKTDFVIKHLCKTEYFGVLGGEPGAIYEFVTKPPPVEEWKFAA